MAGFDPSLDQRVCIDRDLGINDLDIVYSKVKSLSAKWVPFAKSLNLEEWQVKSLKDNEGHDPNYCMKKALEYWLIKKDYKYRKYGVPCWRLVCVAVKEGGDDSDLAEKIAREHLVTSSRVASPERDFFLLSKLYELQMEFTEVLQKTMKSFSSKSKLSEIIDFLIKYIIASLGPHSSNPALVQAVKVEFQNIESIEELFILLQQKYLSWFNLDFILKWLIDKFFSKNHILRRSLLHYENKLNSFFSEQNIGRYSLKDAEGVQFGEFNSPPAAAIKVIAKIGREDYSLYDLFMSCKHNLIAKAMLNAPGFYIYFSFVYNSSYLEYWIPEFIHSLIFPLISEQRKSLREIDITELSFEQPSIQQFLTSTTDKVKLWFQEIEKRLKECDSLKCDLDSVDYFIDEMILNDLAKSREINPIMSEFKTKLKSSRNLQELKKLYSTFIEILEKLDLNDVSKLKIKEEDWSALPRRRTKENSGSWLMTAKQEDASISSKRCPIIEKEHSQQPHLLSSNNDRTTPLGIPNDTSNLVPLPFTEVSSRDLSINDLDAVYTKVKGISGRWITFAGSLHLKQGTIEIIQDNHRGDCESCMREALVRWLKKDYDYKSYGVPCWRLVCIAVKEGGDNSALAEEIARENCLPSRVASSNIYVPSQKKNYELLDKLYNLQNEFSDAIFETIIIFQQELNLSDIIIYLKTHLNTLLGPHWAKRPEAVLAIEEFECITEIPDLFAFLQRKYLSWFNYQLIIKLINKFLNNHEKLKSIWSSYEEKLEEYFMKSGGLLKDAEGIQFGEFNAPPSGSKIMVVCVERDDYTLDHLFFLRKALPKELNVSEYDLYFSFVSIGSLHLEYWIPDFVYLSIFPLSKEQEVGLANLGIVEMSGGDGEYSYDLNEFKTSEKSHHPSYDNTHFDHRIQLIEEDIEFKAMATSHPLFARACSRDLGINDLDIVYSKVKSLSAKWVSFAKSLHLEEWQVKKLEANEGHDPNYCMKKALKYWLIKRDYKYRKYGVPCWRLVCVAVKKGGDDSDLAEKIACEHPVTSSSSKRDFSLLSKLYELQMEFSEIFQKTMQFFSSKSKISEIIDFLIKYIIASLGPHSFNPALVQTVKMEFQSIKSIKELFTLLQQKYLSWFNLDFILKRLIDKFLSKNNILKRNWLHYENKLNSFFSEQNIGRYSLKDVEGVQFGEFNSPPAAAIKVIAKIGREDYSLYDLFMSCKHNLIAKAMLNVPGFYIYFSFVYNSSYLEYWIPDFIHSLIFPLTSERRKSLREIDITELSFKQPSIQQLSTNTTDKWKLWFQEIEKRLKECDSLKCDLDGVDYFIDQMILNDLAKSRKFDLIMSEFKTKLKSSRNVQELKKLYSTFIEILEKLDLNNISKLKIKEEYWSALLRKSTEENLKSWLTTEDIEKEDKSQPMERRPTSSRCVSGKQTEISKGEQMVLGMHKLQESTTQKVVLNDECLINGFKDVIPLGNEPKTRNLEISFAKMKDTILHETIPCNLFLIAFLGLPFSEKSILVHNFLKESAYTIPNDPNPLSTIEYNERGLSVYNTTLMQHDSDEYLWFTLTKEFKEAHPCSSAILNMSFFHDCSLNIVFNRDANHIFQDKILDAHFDLVCKSLQQIDLTQCNYELRHILSSRMIDMNIIDADTNVGVMKFLNCIFHHLSYNLGFVCLSFNDVLHRSPKSANIPAIIRDALKMHSSEAPFIFIIICSERDAESERKIAKNMLLEEVTNINHKLGLQPFKTTALVLDPYSLKDTKKLKNELDEEISKQCVSRRDIKLSWLFLRSALHSSSEDIVISYERLKDIAEKLGIKETEFKEFLEFFSKFMSILYFPSFKPLQNVVILRPVEFINKLSFLLDDKAEFNGIYTIERINEIIPDRDLANIIIDVLCSFGLAMKTTSDKVGQVGRSSLIFLPSARSGQILEKSTTTTTSLFIVYESKMPSLNFQCFFASQLLTHNRGIGIKESYLQVGSEHQNIFKIFLQTTQCQEYTFSFIFHDEYIEVACTLRSNVELKVFEYIFNCCSEALSKITNTTKDFSYKLALKCVAPSPKKEFEFFLQSKSSWCDQCKTLSSLQRKIWKELIEKTKEKEERRESVNVEKLLEWARKIGPHIRSKQKLNNFAQRLSVEIDNNYLIFLHQECPPWQQVFTVFSLLDKRNKATREKIEAAVAYLKLPREILD